MKNVIINFALLLMVLTGTQCSSLSRDDQISTQGEIAPTTNDLVAALPLDLYLDQIQFKGHLDADVFYNSHPPFEVHIMNEDETKLLACVGSQQKSTLGDMGEAIITYADIEAPFVVDAAAVLKADTPVVVRLVEKHSNSNCPLGFKGGQAGDPNASQYDRILDKQTIEFGQMTTQKIILPDVADLAFKTAAQDNWPIGQTPSIANGILSADQVKINADVNFGEATYPELALLLGEEGAETPKACVDIVDVDSRGLTYGTMKYDFQDADDRDVRLSDFDNTKNYFIELVEIDNGDCHDLLDADTTLGVGVSVLEKSDPVLLENLVDTFVSLKHADDYVLLVTR